ncbi:MAG TPA: MFS transporter, partial [Pseudomonas sp.]|nr:MFS transporter [Pseudomonas sp.]
VTAAFGWNAAGPVVLLAALAAGVTALLLPAALQRSEPAKAGSPERSRSGDVQC